MNIVWGFPIIVVAAAVAATTDALGAAAGTRGELLRDSDRAAGIFGVLATGFSVLLGS
jgi:hypothetical protein